ncbi:nitronate monooxygenase [Cryobacterium psychrophilum]|uniref:Probable nitronate monooxygenase n=1 Tax=Cryobacterium psychrophilum TaxID=41988 RepID=A0A4Y8KS59_9MICO|nr:nitronate monooxygenase [Cryobacterium psychrophilum]TDW29427.1 nitroalkane oxidase [Cryobacterium psychrophilum]TFD81430.1 nitronate monooxygenase [Cryobacterium psychrophilum]
MFILAELEIPIIAAPMAGGASTPALVASVAEGGGLGFLAAGYKTPELLAQQIRAVRSHSAHPFGVNVFVPQAPASDLAGVERYRRELELRAAAAGIDLPPTRITDDDGFDEKIALLCELRVAVVSFTFGLPPTHVVAALQVAGSIVVATVTSVAEARQAEALGVDALCVQGPEAGGHRGTFVTENEPETIPLPELVAAIHAECGLPLVAAGGIHAGEQIVALLAAGATAVQLGTAFLRTDESGANAAHKDALAAARFDRTVITRAFSGRAARGLLNAFIAEHDAGAPRAYPQVHHLTAPLRADAARRADPDGLALWAGTGFRAAQCGPAAAVVTTLWRERRLL